MNADTRGYGRIFRHGGAEENEHENVFLMSLRLGLRSDLHPSKPTPGLPGAPGLRQRGVDLISHLPRAYPQRASAPPERAWASLLPRLTALESGWGWRFVASGCIFERGVETRRKTKSWLMLAPRNGATMFCHIGSHGFKTDTEDGPISSGAEIARIASRSRQN